MVALVVQITKTWPFLSLSLHQENVAERLEQLRVIETSVEALPTKFCDLVNRLQAVRGGEK